MIPDTEARATKHSYSAQERSTSTGWPCCKNERRKTIKAPAVWRTVRGQDVQQALDGLEGISIVADGIPIIVRGEAEADIVHQSQWGV